MEEQTISNFIEAIRANLNGQLPGEEAQYEMAPLGRPPKNISLKGYAKKPKKSAVLILLYPENEKLHTVLMLRNDYKGVHAKQVSFPGGRVEPQDLSLTYTALRETNEEIGVNPNKIEVLGPLTELFIPPSGFLVFPFVGYINHKPNFIPDQIEVNELIFPSLQSLSNPTLKTTAMVESGISNTKINAPCFNVEGHIVWGATAMMLNEFISIYNQIPKSLKHN